MKRYRFHIKGNDTFDYWDETKAESINLALANVYKIMDSLQKLTIEELQVLSIVLVN